jgi:uncharacterized protein
VFAGVLTEPATLRRIAVVGAGIAGLAAARGLSGDERVTLYEASARFGGHAHTVPVTLEGKTHGVDTGFLVLNERTYPRLQQLFAELGVAVAKSDMSFSVQVPGDGIEWSGHDLGSVFVQRRNLARPRFWQMLADLLRFNRLATAIAMRTEPENAALNEPLGDFLDRHRFGTPFRQWYLLPMIGSIWSAPLQQMLDFPVATLIRFCHNHGLLQIADRPQWYTVMGGSARYVEKIVAGLPDARPATPVRSVRRNAGAVQVSTDAGTETYDAVVMACHADQALALLADPSADERAVLGAIRTQPNLGVLHTDAGLLPTRRRAWAAWNHEHAAAGTSARAGVCLHYWLNRLQPLPFETPLVLTLNPLREPRAETVIGRYDYAHPVFDAAAVAAQRRLPHLQGVRGTWYCGAWTGYGFHEDGLASGLAVCAALRDLPQTAKPAAVPA